MKQGEKAPLLHPTSGKHSKFTLVIHGGAGAMSKERSTPEQRQAYKNALADALRAGHTVLREGGEALDAAVAAVTVLEDNPLFNAGKGAVFNRDGKNELEASVMLTRPPISHPEIPSTRRGLGLTLLTRVKNPCRLARALYLNPQLDPHALLSGRTAETLGESLGEVLVDPSYFYTEHRWKEHRRGLGLPDDLADRGLEDLSESEKSEIPLDQFPTGTVGAVALDSYGCIVALTSTGGLTNKLVGRIGDTPLMGAGFWAEEWKDRPNFITNLWRRVTGKGSKVQGVGISGTGDGDYFIRQSTASTIARRIRFSGDSLDKAASETIKELRQLGGLGGAIALDTKGNVSMHLNCPGMYRGFIREDGLPRTAIFADEECE